MKFKLFIVLILALLIFEICGKAEDKKVEKSSEAGMKHLHKLRARVKVKSTGSAKSTNSKNSTAPLILNSVGRKVYVNKVDEIVLTKWPFDVTRCDQVVAFKAQFIPSLNEYRARQNGFFTITAHYLNLFASDNAQKLLKSILLSEMTVMPRIFKGSGGCIMVQSSDGEPHNITICTDDKKKQANILEVLQVFTDCRGGNTLKKLDPLKVAMMIKACGGKGRFVHPTHLIKNLQNRRKRLVHKDISFFHPGSDDVPGIPKESEGYHIHKYLPQ